MHRLVPFLLVLASLVTGCAPTLKPVEADKGYVLYFPGAAGWTGVDDQFVDTIRDSLPPDVRVDPYDWTPRGLMHEYDAIYDDDHHRTESAKISKMITDRLAVSDGKPVDLIGHSAGTGVAILALEKLPSEAKVRNVILLASALSAGYDLAPALAHVSGTIYVVASDQDEVLPLTKSFRTFDGPTTQAAGMTGFTHTYDNVRLIPYQKSWIKYGYFGTHVTILAKSFAREVISPWLQPSPTNAPPPHPHPLSYAPAP